jgi:energy-coupling factor transporter ATP-binding protein EcfA2
MDTFGDKVKDRLHGAKDRIPSPSELGKSARELGHSFMNKLSNLSSRETTDTDRKEARSGNASMSTQPLNDRAIGILIAEGEKVSITDDKHLSESKSFVGFMGPPGAGKSSLCNTVVYCQQDKTVKKLFFEPSNDFETFTKGLWMLSRETKRQFKKDFDWEVLDMEGFQHKKEGCWKMAMVLSVLAEIVVFCNRNPRCDVLFEAAEVFKKGVDFCKDLSMSPITKQVFIQVDSRTYENTVQVNRVIEKVISILQNPEIKVIAFCIVEMPHANLKELPFEPAIMEAVRSLLNQFQFEKNSQAIAAKVEQLGALLKAFNDNNFDECHARSLKFLAMDCKRIYQEAEARKRMEHNELASNKELTSLTTTFEEFMGQPNWGLDLHFEKSPFYVEKHEQNLQNWYPSEKRSIEMVSIYREYYEKKKKTLEAKLETEKALDEASKAEFKALQTAAISKAKSALETYFSKLELNRPMYNYISFAHYESFIVKSELNRFIEKNNISVVPDWSEVETEYYSKQKKIESEWSAQIARAQWVAPVKAQGTLTCQGGHNMSDEVVCRKSQCSSRLFWIDGPHKFVMCSSCKDITQMSDSLVCTACNALCHCTTRPTGYIP